MMDAIIYTLYAVAIALWWYLFREARRIERQRRLIERLDDAYRESVRKAGEGMER